jgi:hypothetical protein
MRDLCFAAGVALLLTGCIADRDKPGMQIKCEALDAAQSLVTPELIKDCSDRITKERPNVTLVGPLGLSARAAARVGDLQMFPSGPNDDIVALVAPTTNKGLFGQDNKSYAECSYRLQDNKLVFRAVHCPEAFAPKIIMVR